MIATVASLAATKAGQLRTTGLGLGLGHYPLADAGSADKENPAGSVPGRAAAGVGTAGKPAILAARPTPPASAGLTAAACAPAPAGGGAGGGSLLEAMKSSMQQRLKLVGEPASSGADDSMDVTDSWTNA
jgi:hypothetical protein